MIAATALATGGLIRFAIAFRSNLTARERVVLYKRVQFSVVATAEPVSGNGGTVRQHRQDRSHPNASARAGRAAGSMETRRSAPGEEALAAEPGFIGQIGNVDDLN